MKTYVNRKKEDNAQAVAHELSQSQSGREPTIRFEDNRAEAVAQRKLQKTIDSRSQAIQLQPKGEEHVAGDGDKVAADPLTINYVWLGNRELGGLEKFNVFSWRALGHNVNIFALRFDRTVAGHGHLKIATDDANVIDLGKELELDDKAEGKDNPKVILGDTRSVLKSWIAAIPKGGSPSNDHIYNMVDIAKSYIGGSRQGIVLDMKVGPSEHLPAYAASFKNRFISYSRGGKATAGVENQSMGTMQESDDLRRIYATRFNAQIIANMSDLAAMPNKKWFDNITNYHGRAFLLGLKDEQKMDVATQSPSGAKFEETGKDYEVSEPKKPGRGPFRVFKAASEQSNESGPKSTKSDDVQKLAMGVLENQLSGLDPDKQSFVDKARDAQKAIK